MKSARRIGLARCDPVAHYSQDTYTLYGTYEPTTATAADPFYYVNINGTLSYGDAVTVGAFRWIMRVESKFGNKPAYVRQMVFFDGEEATGIISVHGLRFMVPMCGTRSMVASSTASRRQEAYI